VTDRTRAASTVAGPGSAGPSPSDVAKIRALIRMRTDNRRVVNDGAVESFRRRRIPTSVMPRLEPACGHYSGMAWAPDTLLVPTRIPREGRLAPGYRARYYGLMKLGWKLYNRRPIDPDVLWDPGFEWNHAFPPTGDGWEHPTSDETFARLRLQGPDPWLLERVADTPTSGGSPEPTFELDFTDLFSGVAPAVAARFAVRRDEFVATGITVGAGQHQPGDETWDAAKRLVNALDARYAGFGRHLLDGHWIVGQAFALATFALPTWHRLRPFMAFFTYATLDVNDIAYQAIMQPGSYFIESGFASAEDARHLFHNSIARFDLGQWIAPRDIERRGIAAIPDHPYVEDAGLVWPAFVEVVERHLDDLRLDDAAIAADLDLQAWSRTLAAILPDADPTAPLDRARLQDLCTALLWNNVIHEICGDFSPILGSEDPADKAMINLANVKAAVGDGDLTRPIAPATMADVFLMDQASHMSRINVGGNNILAVNAAAVVDDPKLRLAVEDLQDTLRDLEEELVDRNQRRPVSFNRMLPRHWEASISF
jgi:hypothetical protein